MRVLIVDDNPADRALSRREVLKVEPEAEIREAGSMEALQAALDTGAFDVAVLDFSLGWSNGVTLLHLVRDRHPDTAAVLFTGSLGEEEAVDAIKAGFDDYVIKDVSRLPRLRASIESLAKRTAERRFGRQAEKRYRDLFEAVSVGVFSCREDGRFEEGNPALLRDLGVGADELRTLNLLNLDSTPGLRDRWSRLADQAITRLPAELTRPDGRRMSVLLDARRQADGTVQGLVTDVTALQRALEQRETLLREVYHRVYNNLAQVEALLLLQARKFDDPEVRRAFKEMGERLRSIALVQQKLYGGGDYTQVDFAAYLHELADSLRGLAGSSEIRIDVRAEPVSVAVDRAVPLGLIANELLTNALKHAYPDGGAGTIAVVLTVSDGRGLLVVRDGGVGVDPAVVTGGAGLGSRLLPNLARQIDADLSVRSEAGVEARVLFPL